MKLKSGHWTCICLLLLLHGFVLGTATAFDAAPFLSWETEDAGSSWRALGPFFEHDPNWQDEWRLTALLRPVYTKFEHREEDKSGFDFIWPLCMSRQRKEQLLQRFVLALHTNQDIENMDSGERWWLVPVFFTGKSSEDGEPYFALFPVGGRIADVIGYDHVDFALFPLYLSTYKGRQRSQSIVWPIFSRTDGATVQKWRVFPLYGRAETDTAVRQFVLWPFIHLARQEEDPDSGLSGQGFFVLPLYGQFVQREEDGAQRFRSWTVLWPFFSGEKSEARSRLHCPWPFIQLERLEAGAGSRRKIYLWPIFGSYERPREHRRFVLWPFWQDWDIGTDSEGRRVRSLFPFYWSVIAHEEGEVLDTYHRIWPLFRYEREGEDTRFNTLALWPQRRAAAIQRNYAPLWTLYQYRGSGDSRRHDLLWGLWQYEVEPDAKEMSLFPLFHWQRTEDDYEFSILQGLIGWGRRDEDSRRRFLWLIRW